MGSPITFSGFNSIDFNVVLNAIMQQESAPLQALQAKQTELQATDSTFGQLATKLDALRTASGALSDSSTLNTYAATSSDTTALTASASATRRRGTLRSEGQPARACPGDGLEYVRTRHQHDDRRDGRQPDGRHRADQHLRLRSRSSSSRPRSTPTPTRRPARRSSPRSLASTVWC